MDRKGLLIGEVAKRGGISRKAFRVYEAEGILQPPHRTAADYRVYDGGTLALLSFVRQAQRLAFTLDEIREIVGMKRAGRVPCPHVRDLVRGKAAELDQKLSALLEVRKGLRALQNAWRSVRQSRSVVCPHIERTSPSGREVKRRWNA